MTPKYYSTDRWIVNRIANHRIGNCFACRNSAMLTWTLAVALLEDGVRGLYLELVAQRLGSFATNEQPKAVCPI